MTKSCNTNTNKEAEARRRFYRALCDSPQGADIPLFAQAWWLDATCPEAWTVLTFPKWPDGAVSETGTETDPETGFRPLAAMPIHTPYADTVGMPFFTQTSYIWQSTEKQTKSIRLSRALAEALNRYRYVYLQWPVGQWQAQPFYWHGLNLNVRYTYRLEDLKIWREQGGTEAVSAALRAGMGRDSRRHLRSAEAQGLTVRPCPVDEFCRLHRQTFVSRGVRLPEAAFASLTRLIETACQRRQGLLWGGYDASGSLQAAAFIAWQGRTAYYVAGGHRPQQRPSHAQTLVLFKVIEHCAGFCDVFDFEGSMIEGIAQFFQGFGAQPRPYLALCGRQPGLLRRAWRKFDRLLHKP